MKFIQHAYITYISTITGALDLFKATTPIMPSRFCETFFTYLSAILNIYCGYITDIYKITSLIIIYIGNSKKIIAPISSLRIANL